MCKPNYMGESLGTGVGNGGKEHVPNYPPREDSFLAHSMRDVIFILGGVGVYLTTPDIF